MGEHEHEGGWLRYSIISAILLASALVFEHILGDPYITQLEPILGPHSTVSQVLYHILIFIFGGYIFIKGIKILIFEKRFSTEFLMGTVAIASTYIDLLFEGAMVITLFLISEYLEEYIEDRARESVKKLIRYLPEEARVIRGGREVSVPVDEVGIGDVVVVKPGERIPLDGVIIDGMSSIDESTITGENLPVFKGVGSTVYGGTLNLDGLLKIRVLKPHEDTLVSKIVRLVAEARSRKASIENFVDKFARIYVPVIVLLSVLVTAVPLVMFGGEPSYWIYRSMILLVLACPSAFIISVPATYFAAITMAANRGSIIKGGIYLEKLSKVDTVIFDKTGTLTYGELRVVSECSGSTIKDRNILSFVAAVERYSNHPVAKGIVEYVSSLGIEVPKEIKSIREYPGKGIIGYVNGKRIVIGNIEMLEGIGNISGLNFEGDDHLNIHVAVEEEYMGSLCLEDKIREDAIQAVNELKKMNIKTVILTGDRRDVAERVAKTLGIDEYYAEVKPHEKLEIVEKYRMDGHVAMVGDGVNDAPALAAADVGIAMGGSGTEVALDTSDIVLVKDDLSSIPMLIRLARKTYEIARENIYLSIISKMFLGILGLVGFIPLWSVVALGDDGITLFLLLNIARIRRF